MGLSRKVPSKAWDHPVEIFSAIRTRPHFDSLKKKIGTVSIDSID